jgi:hypothetical protein
LPAFLTHDFGYTGRKKASTGPEGLIEDDLLEAHDELPKNYPA